MTPFDYSVPPPQAALNLIPAKTIARLRMDINAGGVGEDGMLTLSKSGSGCEMLSYTLTVLDGPHAKRKIFGQFIEGPRDRYEDQFWRAVRMRKRILESAYNLDPRDTKPETKAKLNVSYAGFDGRVFYGRVGIEPGNGDWPAKNVLAGTVTRNEGDWPGPIEQPPPDSSPPVSPSSPSQPSASPAAIERPAWARE
jgi:hypothetical protein